MRRCITPPNWTPMALALGSLLSALPVPAARAHSAALTDVPSLATTVVIDTTPLAGLGVPLDRIPANVQVMSGAKLRTQHHASLTDYFSDNLTSVEIHSSQGNPYQPDVDYRGFTASPLLGTPQGLSVFQDGVRINEPFGDVVNWDLLPQSAIKSVQLIPGSNPLFGLNTLGGALAIATRSGRDSPGGAAEVTGGSFGRRGVEFEQGGRHGKLDYFLTLNDERDGGWSDHNASRIRQLFGKLGYADENSSIALSLSAADNDLQGAQTIPRSFLDNFRQAYTYPDLNLNRATLFNLSGTHFFNDQVQLNANAYYRSYRNQNLSSNVNGDYGAIGPLSGRPDTVEANNAISAIDQQSYGFGLQLTLLGQLAGMPNQFVAGTSGDFANSRFSQSSQDAQFTPDRNTVGIGDYALRTDAKTHNGDIGLFMTDTLSLSDRVTLTASARYDHAQIDIADQTGRQPLLDGNHSFSRLNPALGVTFNPTPRLSAYAAYNEGMRSPTAIELACADPAAPCSLPNDFIADPALRPVIAKTVELGLRGKLGAASSWHVSVYRTALLDDIAFVSSSAAASSGYFQNVGQTRRQGVEAQLSTRSGSVGVTASYSYIAATYRTAFTERSPSNSSADANGNIVVRPGDRMPGIPDSIFKLRLDYAVTPSWHAGANLSYRSAIFARGDENNRDINGKIAGYAVVDLDTTFRATRSLTLFARVNNLFDKRYANFGSLGQNFFSGPGHTFSGNDVTNEQFVSPGAPRGIWVGLRYAWR
ncbi:TonB-dependent receptor [Pandoraea thiooxydans]|nr:TonB-dependent receptor [Pandoraea thiooxydans]